MKIWASHQQGNIELHTGEDVLITPQGEHEGNIIIHHGASLAVDGRCRGIVIVEKGGSLRIGGVVEGYVFNLGGTMIIEDQARITAKAVHFDGLTLGKAYACRLPEDKAKG